MYWVNNRDKNRSIRNTHLIQNKGKEKIDGIFKKSNNFVLWYNINNYIKYEQSKYISIRLSDYAVHKNLL